MTKKEPSNPKKKILLAMLPYWDPMIPPNGIAHLKSFLQQRGYQVKAVDVLFEENFQEIYNNYFDYLKSCIPEANWGNFYNIGHDVMQDHMMAHFNHDDPEKYVELVKLLVHTTFYYQLTDDQAGYLNSLLDDFYRRLESYFTRLLEIEKPDVVGATSYKCTVPASLFALRLTKRKYPDITTVLGGNNFVDMHAIGTPSFDALLDYSRDFLDKIFVAAQGELLFYKFLEGQLPQSKRVYTREDIDGEIIPFEQMHAPDFSDFDMQRYPFLPATGSASCPFQCSFCSASNFYGKHRKKDVKQTVAEMVDLHRSHGHQLFFLTDSLVNTIAADLAKEVIDCGHPLYYDVYYRVDKPSADVQNTLLWREGGMYRVRIGCESGSPRVLDMMGKKITPQQIKESVSALALAGIKTTTYWAIGHPGETEEDFQQTLDLVTELKDDIFQAETNPFLYYFSTQSHADMWAGNRLPLYPDWAQKMMVFKLWTLDLEPLREEAYHRLFRFEQHCRKLGIPNPYSYNEHIKADQRWRTLHKHAVPPMRDFLAGGGLVTEPRSIKQAVAAKSNRQQNIDFSF
jgi:radical SAM superfamily enzyme YgiQ (UPF0313 family)